MKKISCGRKYQPYIGEVRSLETLRCLVFVWRPLIVNAFTEFINMEKIGHCFHLKGLSPVKIKAELDSTLWKSATSSTTIKCLVVELKRDRKTCQDKYRSIDQLRSPEMVKKIHKNGWPSTESARVRRCSTYFKKCCKTHIDWKFGNEKVVCVCSQ